MATNRSIQSAPVQEASSLASGRVTLENVNHPGKQSSADAGMYRAMRAAILEVLPAGAPGLTIGQMQHALERHLPEDLFPGGAKAGWWCKAVQLDLEAKGVIVREKSKPLRLYRNSR